MREKIKKIVFKLDRHITTIIIMIILIFTTVGYLKASPHGTSSTNQLFEAQRMENNQQVYQLTIYGENNKIIFNDKVTDNDYRISSSLFSNEKNITVIHNKGQSDEYIETFKNYQNYSLKEVEDRQISNQIKKEASKKMKSSEKEANRGILVEIEMFCFGGFLGITLLGIVELLKYKL